jgi:hypothetical protein
MRAIFIGVAAAFSASAGAAFAATDSRPPPLPSLPAEPAAIVEPARAAPDPVVVEVADPRYRAIRVQASASEIESARGDVQRLYRGLVKSAHASSANVVVVEGGRVFLRRGENVALAQSFQLPEALPALEQAVVPETPVAEVQAVAEDPLPAQPRETRRVADAVPSAPRRAGATVSPHAEDAAQSPQPEGLHVAIETPEAKPESILLADLQITPEILFQDEPSSGGAVHADGDAISGGGTLSFAPRNTHAYAVVGLESRGSIVAAPADDRSAWLLA